MVNTQAIIVGGGPVGLFLALALTKRGIDCQVLERRTGIDPHSKSLGIHPVSLDLFDELGISDLFLRDGLQITRGVAYINGDAVGTLSLGLCPPPHQYVLSLQQSQTEALLESHLKGLKPGIVTRGAAVTAIDSRNDTVRVMYTHNDNEFTLEGVFVVGCDGKTSFTRRAAGIPFHGDSYPDTFLMGDFSDNTNLGRDAAIFLHKDGLTESFPIPGGSRRWIVSTDQYVEEPDRTLIEALAAERSGYSLKGTTNSMLSSFGVQHFLAESFYRDRILLAGDAAHVVSPIGGQGMNLGWLGARDLAGAIRQAIRQPDEADNLFRLWETNHRKRVVKAANRAEWNMKMGRKRRYPLLRNLMTRLILTSPFNRRFANIFTMQDLK